LIHHWPTKTTPLRSRKSTATSVSNNYLSTAFALNCETMVLGRAGVLWQCAICVCTCPLGRLARNWGSEPRKWHLRTLPSSSVGLPVRLLPNPFPVLGARPGTVRALLFAAIKTVRSSSSVMCPGLRHLVEITVRHFHRRGFTACRAAKCGDINSLVASRTSDPRLAVLAAMP